MMHRELLRGSLAVLSRGFAGAAGRTFIINPPGPPKCVMDGLTVLDPLIGHLCDQLEGEMGTESSFEVSTLS